MQRERLLDAVIDADGFLEAIGSDLLGTVAGADHGAALGAAAGVDLAVGGEDVEGAAEAPGPEANGAPCVRRAFFRGAGGEEGADGFGETADVVGAEVAIVGADRGVAASDDFFDFPTVGVSAAGFFSGAMVGDTELARYSVDPAYVGVG